MTPTTIPAEMHEAITMIERLGGRALVDKIVTMFESSARDRFAKLDVLISAGDSHQVSRIGHAMKGSAAQVGATGFRDLAAALEKDAATLDAEGLAALVTRLRDAFSISLDQLAACRSAGAQE
ncbi:MAG: Hpt domain-containing protein [Gemmatimonadetes bacterium]|nr:Hpt domain-containing protein [Gemmatimonadota bacterium]